MCENIDPRESEISPRSISRPPLRLAIENVTVAFWVAARGPERPPLDTAHGMGARTTSPSAVSYRGSATRRRELEPACRAEEDTLQTMSRCSFQRDRSLPWLRIDSSSAATSFPADMFVCLFVARAPAAKLPRASGRYHFYAGIISS